MKCSLNFIKMLFIISSIFFTVSCKNGPSGLPSIPGVSGPLFNLVDGKILLTMKFLNLNLDAGFKGPIPETRNSSFEFAPNIEDGGTIVVFHLDVEDLRSIDIGVGDGNYLPDGRPVPGVPGGKLENSLRVDTNWNKLSFFYHKKLFGVWMPFGFETAGLSGYWNLNFNNKNIGMLGLVGNDPINGYKAGGIIFLRLENLSNPALKRLIKTSKRHPHLVF